SCLAIISPPTVLCRPWGQGFRCTVCALPRSDEPLPSAAESLRVTDRAAVAAMNAVPAIVVQKDQVYGGHVAHDLAHPVELLHARVRSALGDRVECLDLHLPLRCA